MTNQPFYNSYEANKRGSQTAQNVLKGATVVLYESIKWLFDFGGRMVRQFLGK